MSNITRTLLISIPIHTKWHFVQSQNHIYLRSYEVARGIPNVHGIMLYSWTYFAVCINRGAAANVHICGYRFVHIRMG